MNFCSCDSGYFSPLPWSWVLCGREGRLRPSTQRQNSEISRFAATKVHHTRLADEPWRGLADGGGDSIWTRTVDRITIPAMTFVLAQEAAVFLPMIILLVIGIVFGISNLLLPKLFAWLGGNRKNDGRTKQMTYETGMDPIGTARKRFNIRFYILAMTFLVFDVEIVFLYPWATVFPNLAKGEGMDALFLYRMIFFVATSVVAYLYAWRKGVFRFD